MDAHQFRRMVAPIVQAQKSFNKIFCIGQNKTGTTSLEALLMLYGYRLPTQAVQEKKVTRQAFLGNYRPLNDFVPHYDAFQDQPFSQGDIYIAADCLFPGSKFILTYRDSDAWFDSLCRFHSQLFGVKDINAVTEEDVLKFDYLYPGYCHETVKQLLTVYERGQVKVRWDLLYDRAFYIEMYERRNAAIRCYFAERPEDFLAIDFTEQRTSEEICQFLNIPEEFTIEVPHLNRTSWDPPVATHNSPISAQQEA